MGRKKLEPGEKTAKEQIKYFAAMGWTTKAIAKKVGCSKDYVNQVRNPPEWISSDQPEGFWDQVRIADEAYKAVKK
jgi:hypothetical protein